ncbi:MAG: biotin/lipoyl-containing protein, partial [Candidatus Thermoplasmatota archaeon]
SFRITDFQAAGAPGAHGGARKAAKIKPPMPGKIVTVNVQEGQEVKAGQVLLVLEAMKMQNEIAATGVGTVKRVHVKAGQNVEVKDVLIEIE